MKLTSCWSPEYGCDTSDQSQESKGRRESLQANDVAQDDGGQRNVRGYKNNRKIVFSSCGHFSVMSTSN